MLVICARGVFAVAGAALIMTPLRPLTSQYVTKPHCNILLTIACQETGQRGSGWSSANDQKLSLYFGGHLLRRVRVVRLDSPCLTNPRNWYFGAISSTVGIWKHAIAN